MIKKLRAKHVPETAYLIMFTIFSAAAFIEGTTLTHVFGVDRLMALTYRIYQLSVLGVLGKIFFLDDSTKKTKTGIFLTLAVLYFICHRAQAMAPFFHGHFHLRCSRSRLEKDSEMFLFHWSAFDVPFAFWRFVSHNS